MNFDLITLEYPPRIGGAGCVAQDIANVMSKNGHHVCVVTVYDSSFVELITGVVKCESINSHLKIKKIPVWKKKWFISFPFYLLKVKTKRNDITLINDFGAGYAVYMNRHKINEPYYMYVHGKEQCILSDSIVKNGFFKFKKSFLFNLVNSSGVICVSSFISKWLCSESSVKDIENRVDIIPNIVDVKLFEFVDKELIPSEFMITPPIGAFKFITVCRFVKMKGFDDKLEILSSLIDRGYNVIWYIAGDGEYKNDFINKVNRLGLSSYVVFLGRIDRGNLKYYYSQCDLFWLLSCYEEAYPLVYHEAQACLLPVIGLNKGGVSEVINNKIDGFVINSKYEFIDIFENKEIESLDMSLWKKSEHSPDMLYENLMNKFQK
ncbi:glycosyltransferase family 4 protein [Aliivibrio fischeri]|uniref:glycosyltransferase family 4 protein n=1 Tax=Aliivibrio fischeri TaxID=668 RepID=UPI00354BE97A